MALDHRRRRTLTCVAFCASGLCAFFLNKILFSRFVFDFALVILLLQEAAVLLCLELLKFFNFANIVSYTLERGRETFLLSFLYCVHTILSASVLSANDLGLYASIQRFLPLLVAYISKASGARHNRSSVSTLLPICLLSVGAALASFTRLETDNPTIYFTSIASLLLHVCLLIVLDRTTLTIASPIDILYLTSFNSIPILLTLNVIAPRIGLAGTDAIFGAFFYAFMSASGAFLAFLLAAIVVGIAANFALLVCIDEFGATTTAVFSVGRALLHLVLVGAFGGGYFDNFAPLGSVRVLGGLALAAVGAGAYLRRNVRCDVGNLRLDANGNEKPMV